MTRAVLLSVQPRFARALLDGIKTAEVRRRFPHLAAGTILFLYSSTPDRAVLGTMTVQRTVQVPVGEVWARYRGVIEIERDPLHSYLDGAPHATVLEVMRPERWAIPFDLSMLRRELGIEPAQSFRYLDADAVEALRPGARRRTHRPARVGYELPQVAAAFI